MPLPVTSLYTGFFLLLMLALAVNVVRLRMSEKVSLGDGDNRRVRQAMRAHANAAEYVPVVLIGLALLELAGVAAWMLLLYGSVFLVGRVLHAIGMVQPRSVTRMRQLGIVLSWAVMLTMAAHLLVLAFGSL